MGFINPMSYDIAKIEMAEREREGARRRQAEAARQFTRKERTPARRRMMRFPTIRIVISWHEAA